RRRAISGGGTKLPRSSPHSNSWPATPRRPRGLAAREVLHVVRVAQQQLDVVEIDEHMPHRTPIDPGRFHRHLRHTLGGQPRPQLAQRRRPGSELPDLLHPSPATCTRLANARHHRVLVHIERRATINDHIHATTSPSPMRWPPLGLLASTESETRARSNNPRCLEAPAPV